MYLRWARKYSYLIVAIVISVIMIGMTMAIYFNPNINTDSFWGKGIQVLQGVDQKLYDFNYRFRGNTENSAPVVIVSVDEKSLQDLGRWQSWPRMYYAQVIKSLDEYGAKVISFDIVFDFKDRNTKSTMLDELIQNYPKMHKKKSIAFVNAMEQAQKYASTDWMLESSVNYFNSQANRSLVLGYFVETQRQYDSQEFPEAFKPLKRSILPSRPSGFIPTELKEYVSNFGVSYTELAKMTGDHGYFSMSPDADGVVREYKIIRSMYGHLFPSLALQTVSKYWDTFSFVEWTDNGFGSVHFSGRSEQIYLPYRGEIKVHYYGAQNTFPTVSLSDVINSSSVISYRTTQGKVITLSKDELFKDKIVLVGATATGIYDVRSTPVQVNLPGVEIHASVIAQLIEGKIFSGLNDKTLLSFVLVTLFGCLLLSFCIQYFSVYISLGILITLVSGGLYVQYYYLFLEMVNLNVSVCLIGWPLLYIILSSIKIIQEQSEKQMIRHAFGSYVSKDVVDQLIEHPDMVKLGGESKELSVLFSDIESFTIISEKIPASELTRILSIYLDYMGKAIFEVKGTLDKYIGDAVMAFWGAPIDDENHAVHAVEAALRMLEREEEVNKMIESTGITLKTRIGINTGRMSVGNMGSTQQFSYTVIGDSVNLGARLEGLNKDYGTRIIISNSTAEYIKDHFIIREIDRVAVKGKKEITIVYEVMGRVNNFELPLWVQSFNLARDLYYQGMFEDAHKRFSELEQAHGDSVSSALKLRCEVLMKDVDDWPGHWVLDHK